jgi:hypothetical protein
MHDDAPGSKASAEPADPDAVDSQELLHLRQRLKKDDGPGALQIVRGLIENPDELFGALGGVRRPFLKAGRGMELMDFLLALPSQHLRHLGVIGLLLELGADAGSRLSPEALEQHLRERGVLDDVAFFPNDYLVRFARLGPAAMRVLVACKYRGQFFDDRDQFWDTARVTARRMQMPGFLLDELFGISRVKDMGRAAWEGSLREAFAVDHMTLDYRFVRDLRGAAKWNLERRRHALAAADAEAAKAVFAGFDAPDGLVLSTFHGGLLAPAAEMYDVFFPRGEHLDGTTRRKGDAGMSKTDQIGAGFATLKSLSNGGVVIVAPDGGRGKAATQITVAGRTMAFPDGAPFLAYEAGCRTGWFGARREGARLVPEFIEGPRREDGERYRAFKTRFFDFYAAQIERVITGDPASLALRPRWSKLFRDWADPAEASA